MKITSARQNKRETILRIDEITSKNEGASLEKFLNKYFGIRKK